MTRRGDEPPANVEVDTSAWPVVDLVVNEAESAVVAPFVGLRDRPLRDRCGAEWPHGRFLVEGDVVVARALAAGHRLLSLLIEQGRRRPLPDGVAEARAGGAQVIGAGPGLVLAITGSATHSGCLGLFARPGPADPADVLVGRRSVVVTEGVANPVNLGLIARSAVAMGAEALLLDPSSADPLYRRSSRVSMGEVFAVPHARVEELPGGLKPLTAAGFEVWALTPERDAVDIAHLQVGPDAPVALLVGSEGPGLSAASLAAAHRRVRIPVSGGVDSLNVGAAAAVAAYALGRARTPAPEAGTSGADRREG